MKLGIMGSGEIVSGMLAIMQQTGTFQCSALFCREESHERGAALAEKYGIANLYHDQEAFFGDDSFDTENTGVLVPPVRQLLSHQVRTYLCHSVRKICATTI